MNAILVLCAVIVGVAIAADGDPAEFQCYVGAGAKAAAATDCPKVDEVAQTKCSGPHFVEYTGYVKPDEAYKCGGCDGSDGCGECTGTLCNAPLEGVHTFKCTEFKYDDDAKKFAAQKDITICNALKATTAVCNSNGAKATDKYEVLDKGCGPCEAEAKTAETCVQCDGDNCNSAATITAFLLPMVALFYTLF